MDSPWHDMAKQFGACASLTYEWCCSTRCFRRLGFVIQGEITSIACRQNHNISFRAGLLLDVLAPSLLAVV